MKRQIVVERVVFVVDGVVVVVDGFVVVVVVVGDVISHVSPDDAVGMVFEGGRGLGTSHVGLNAEDERTLSDWLLEKADLELHRCYGCSRGAW